MNTKDCFYRKAFLPGSIFAIIVILISFSSCQKVVNIDLNSSSPRLVIEGVITDSTGPFHVILTKSGSYFNQPVLPPVSGAFVTVSDDKGNVDTLKEKDPGIYATSKIIGKSGSNYFLKVISENIEYDASTTMKSRVVIDSLTVEETQGFSGKMNQSVICHFRDPIGEKNYYRIKFFVNGKSNADSYRLYDDQYTDGEEINLRVGHADVSDTDVVVLMSIDKQTYDFYHTLEEILRTNPLFGGTPANPNTNLTNNALGYFAAYTVSVKPIIIK